MYKRLFFLIALFFVCALQAQNVVVLMGSPASGKGIFSNHLMTHGHFEHLCPGEMLRDEIAKNNENSLIIQQCLENGDLVPNHILFPLFESQFSAYILEGKDVIVDGIVQSVENVHFFDHLILKYGLENKMSYVYLNITFDTAIDRLLNRLICPDCSKSYSTRDQLTFCPDCHAKLVKRIDDHEITILKRVNRFFGSSIHLIDYYRERPRFYEFSGSVSREAQMNNYHHFLLDIQ